VRKRRGAARSVTKLATVLVAGGLLAAVGLANGSAATVTTRVSLRNTRLGQVFVNSQGRTLYLFAKDTSGKSTCSGSCAKVWQPLIAVGKPIGGSGIEPSRLGVTKRADGTMQVTYDKHPLYSYSLDTSTGQTKGEGLSAFGGVWYAVSPSGAPVRSAPALAAVTTTTTTPTTTTAPATTSTPAPTAPASTAVEAGEYCGFTNNGSSICFDVTAGGLDWENGHYGIVNASCEPGPTYFDATYNTTGQTPIGANLAFNFTATAGDGAGTVITGTFTTSGQAQGHMHVVDALVYQGSQYSCTYDDDWSAKIQH
jgi:predicted lipoprotein with Yx(FWY)xxD motif